MTDDRTDRTKDRSNLADRTDDALSPVRPLDNPADSQAEIEGRRHDLEADLGRLGERSDASNPPADNAPLGDSAGAGMQNPDTQYPDRDRERFRERRM
jgi:hypothetical protein